MVECVECGKKLGIMQGYKHPTMGKKHHLCSPCFDQVSESVAKWKDFVLGNSFNNNQSNINIEQVWKKIIPNSTKINDMIDNIVVEKEFTIQK
jgi:hypothetical protein